MSKVTGAVVRETINPKALEYLPDPGGTGTVAVPVPADRR